MSSRAPAPVSRALWWRVLFGVFVVCLLGPVPTPAWAQDAPLSADQKQALSEWIAARSADLERAAEARVTASLTEEAGSTTESSVSALIAETAEAASPVQSETGASPAAAPPASAPEPEPTAPAESSPAPARPPQAAPAGDLKLLVDILNDPARREALVSLLQAADSGAAPAATTDGTAAASAPGPGVGPGTGITATAPAPAPETASAPPPSEAAGTADDGKGTAPLPIVAPDLSALTAYLHERYEYIVWSSGVTTQVPELLDWIRLQLDDDMRGQWLNLLWQLGLVILVGLLAVVLGRMTVHGAARQLKEKAAETATSRRVVLLLTRLVLQLVPVVLFAIAAQATLPLIDATLRTELVAAAVITSLVMQRAGTVVLRGLFAPRDTSLRLLPLGDEFSAILYRGLRLIVPTIIFGYLAVEVARLFGMPLGSRLLLAHLVGFLVTIFTVRTIFRMRSNVKQAIRAVSLGTSAATAWITGLQRGFADIWHLLAAAYVVVIYVAWVLDSEQWFSLAGWATLKTVMLVIAALVALSWIQTWRDAAMVRLTASTRFDRHMRERTRRYLGLAAGTARILVGLVCLVLILESWSLGAVGWVTDGLGGRAMTIALNLTLVMAVALALWEGVNYAIKGYLTTTDAQGKVIERGQRERTLLPLLRNVLSVFLVVVVTLILLSELGLDIAPLLAGAGVVGLAIGFGSQKLVQDVITGVFNLLEDTIAVGDVVQVGGHAGVVEAMSIRSLRLRDLSGNLHTIPFNGVDTVTNMTKDFSFYLMDIGVAYRENTDEVCQVIRDIGAELQQDPEYGTVILEPVEVLGVDGFQDSAVIIKARIKTKPIMQWWVGREYNRRLKMRFDALGIEIPFPHMTLYFGVDKDGNAPPAHLHVDRLAAMGSRARATTTAGDAVPALAPTPSGAGKPPEGTALLPDPDGEDGSGDGR
ncbi:mechanosensitive ion channel domain-containing protein [Roseospira visakhapatnamensis]|uniref:Small conductance mechanosensitive channel n=1 Tax=Roseospira visakhapatnamensis TaxID=390880 RepID=A0A7W6RAL6_9PROT|nr:mechanosensitive ion channel domain-containing protein [Roseospira visakhapatnamensis]MBB4265016.1 small conductance mechanosensitive channel [Roseospira visakhapatnamensis]